MKRRRRFVSVAAAAFLTGVVGIGALGAGGCGSEPIVVGSPLAPKEPLQRLPDVPVPAGFKYRERGSYTFHENYRVARLRYYGTALVEDVIEFYKEEMRVGRWQFRRDFGLDERVLTFENDLEECRIQVVRHRGLTSLEIEITPLKSS